MKYVAFGVGVITYLVILFFTYYGYINFFSVDVVFYSSIYAALIALFLYAMVICLTPFFWLLNWYEKFNAIIVAGLLGYIIAISLPTVIDRSLSFYILEKLQQRGGGIQLAKFPYIFTVEYMREHKLVDIRLTEQSKSGTIVIDGDCVRLTEKGNKLANFSRYFRKYFLPQKRLLLDEYTDTLIDPFARSDMSPDYLCK
jgi:hypothetical protein